MNRRRMINKITNPLQINKAKQLIHLNKSKPNPKQIITQNKFIKQKQNQISKKQLNEKQITKKQLNQKKELPQKMCMVTLKKLEKISLMENARKTTEHKALSKKYGQLKQKGIDFKLLKSFGYNTQMMLDLGMPTKELINGYLSKEKGLERMVSDITKMHNSNDPHYKKFNFKTLVNNGVPLTKVREARAQLGLLLWEGFTKQELIKAGFEEKRINSIISLIENRQIVNSKLKKTF